MKDIIFEDFQDAVNDSLLRHKSILDMLTKYQESNARVNRAIAKTVTSCGCLQVNAKKQPLTEETIADCLDTHIKGKLCDNCREVIEAEVGNNLFYLASLCNALDINLYDIIIKEEDKMNTLGKFTFR